MKTMKQLISIIAPMYNEGVLVERYCLEMQQALSVIKEQYDIEMILVNDGSSDDTYSEMLRMQNIYPADITIISLSRNFGLEGAVAAGLRKVTGDAVIVMDADLQDPPVLLIEMIKKWQAGADIVVGSRIKRSNDNFFKKLGAAFYYKVLDFLSGKLILEKSAANFRLLSRKALEQVISLPEVNTVFRVLVPFVGMKTDVVEYDRDKRFAGETKYNLTKMIRYALDSITGISIEPLRKVLWTVPVVGMLSIVFFLSSMCIVSELWKVTFFLAGTMSIFFAILFGIIALVAEYIGQIMVEVKGRPTAIVYEYKPCENLKRRGF